MSNNILENIFEYENKDLEALLKALKDYKLDIKVIPIDVIERIKQVSPCFFSSNGKSSPFDRIFSPNYMQRQFERLKAEGIILRLKQLKAEKKFSLQEDVNHIYYWACGLVSTSSSELLFQYLFISPTLSMAISLPYSNKVSEYGQTINSQRLENINYATQLINVCQNKIFPLDNENTRQLSFMLTEEKFYYSVRNAENELIIHGHEMEELLDAIVKYSIQQFEVREHLWLRV